MVCKEIEECYAVAPVTFQSLLCWIMVCKYPVGAIHNITNISFNPCYVGLWSVSALACLGVFGTRCFNPCYVGLWSVSIYAMAERVRLDPVSILVMLDYGL